MNSPETVFSLWFVDIMYLTCVKVQSRFGEFKIDTDV